MRKSRKYIVVSGTVAGVLVGGAAFAYWTSAGSGTGTASTTAGTSNLLITGDVPTALYPGQDAQNFTATVKNLADQSVRVSGLTAYVTTTSQGCDGSNFLINGSSAATPVALAWSTPVDLAKNDSAPSANTIKFNNKTTNQDACKGAAVTLNYAVPQTN